jgi:hypothetical protein
MNECMHACVYKVQERTSSTFNAHTISFVDNDDDYDNGILIIGLRVIEIEIIIQILFLYYYLFRNMLLFLYFFVLFCFVLSIRIASKLQSVINVNMFLFVVVFYFSYSSFLDNGAAPKATNERFWDSRPPLLAAAENGKLLRCS